MNKILYLDDIRTPLQLGIHIARNYDQFVLYLLTAQENNELFDLVSFDHDLAWDHYPLAEDSPGAEIPYESYKEKTGYDCAKWIVENNYPLKFYRVHSYNVIGAANIRNLLRGAKVGQEIDFKIPFTTNSQ